MIRPFSSTIIQSAFITVLNRWAMTKVVLPFISASIPFCTRASVRVSMEEVALTLRKIGAVAGKLCVITLGQPNDKIVGIGKLGCPDAVLVGGIQVAVTDVVHYRAGEQVGVL